MAGSCSHALSLTWPNGVPLFGFREEGLDPNFPLAHRFLIRCSLVIGTDTLAVIFPQVAVDQPAMGTGRTVTFERWPWPTFVEGVK